MTSQEHEDLGIEKADEDDYERWVAGESMSTLRLRAAQHAADRMGEREDARRLSNEIRDREDLEGCG